MIKGKYFGQKYLPPPGGRNKQKSEKQGRNKIFVSISIFFYCFPLFSSKKQGINKEKVGKEEKVHP